MIHHLKKIFTFFALHTNMLPETAHSTQNPNYPPQKVIYHLNSANPEIQQNTLNNIQNHINAVGKNQLEIILLLHGGGISLLLKPEALTHSKLTQAHATLEIQQNIQYLKQQGIQFKVCANTIQNNHINPEHDLFDVHPNDIVPSGVAELAHRQNMGYAYIKP